MWKLGEIPYPTVRNGRDLVVCDVCRARTFDPVVHKKKAVCWLQPISRALRARGLAPASGAGVLIRGTEVVWVQAPMHVDPEDETKAIDGTWASLWALRIARLTRVATSEERRWWINELQFRPDVEEHLEEVRDALRALGGPGAVAAFLREKLPLARSGR